MMLTLKEQRERVETPYLTTPGGIARMGAKLRETRARYLEICRSNEEAAGAGDSSVWHDNFAYEENQRLMYQNARRIAEVEQSLQRLRVVALGGAGPEAATVGVVVRFLYDDEEEESQYFLAGWDDGDPAQRRISYNSPLGQALVGRGLDDGFELRSKGGKRAGVVVGLRWVTEQEDALGCLLGE